MPRLSHKVKNDVAKCHACRTEWRWKRSSATPATQSESRCFQLPHLPHKMKVNVATCHACHTEWRWMLSSAMPATQNGSRLHPITTTATQRVAATNRNQARHHRRPSAISAMPATLSKGQCRQVPRLHTKSHGDKQERSAPPKPAQCH